MYLLNFIQPTLVIASASINESVVFARGYLKLNMGRQSRFCQSVGRIHWDQH
jgi:hypothetical protein